jgi:hypothetical protein
MVDNGGHPRDRKELGKSFEPDVRCDSTIDYFIAGLIAGFILGAVVL